MIDTIKKLYVKTYGCGMNVYDSDRMSDLLRAHGYVLTDSPEDANATIINTCHIRDNATAKLYSLLGKLHSYQKKKHELGEEGLIIVAGCVAQAEGQEIVSRAPYVDIVIGPQMYHQLPEVVEKAKRAYYSKSKKQRFIEIDFPVESKFDYLPLPFVDKDRNSTISALLSIQEGCDKFCSYCVVPFTRGAEVSRPIKDVFKEAQHLVDHGVREITLLGQNVNAYHGQNHLGTGELGLGDLCLELAKIEGLDRIRYTTSHPRDMEQDLIDAHGSCNKIMPFMHLPVQSGSDKVLQAMNRKHTVVFYKEIIDRVRLAQPAIAFSSDFIVGFPGETDQDFEDTLELVRYVKFIQAYSFKYSARPGTAAAVMDLIVPLDVQNDRLQRLQSLLNTYQIEFNQSMVGETLPVLIERKNLMQESGYLGKSPYMQSVHVKYPTNIIGKTVMVKITSAGFKSLEGEILS